MGCATWNGHTMVNIFLLIILVWSVHMTEAQQFEHKKSSKTNNLNDQQELTSSSAAVIQANDKRLRNVNGVTNPNGGAVPPPVQRTLCRTPTWITSPWTIHVTLKMKATCVK